MMLTDTRFKVKDMFYLKTDNDQNQRIVTGILIRENTISYELACGTESTWHFDFEITLKKDVLKTTTN